MNSLVDPAIIGALYEASQAGVAIELNVRGICCIRPGVKGLSDTIRVVSIVDRFLEHSRIFCFNSGGERVTFISSADWMPRNLDRRVEVLVSLSPGHAQQVSSLIDMGFDDRTKAWIGQPDGTWTPHLVDSTGEPCLDLQDHLSDRRSGAPRRSAG